MTSFSYTSILFFCIISKVQVKVSVTSHHLEESFPYYLVRTRLSHQKGTNLDVFCDVFGCDVQMPFVLVLKNWVSLLSLWILVFYLQKNKRLPKMDISLWSPRLGCIMLYSLHRYPMILSVKTTCIRSIHMY